MTAIYNGIYLGSIEDAFSKDFMCSMPTAVLNCAKEVPKSPYATTYMHLPLNDVDDEKITPYFELANNFIDDQLIKGIRVLVHCHAGISRSASIVIGYLINRRGMTFSNAYAYVKTKRKIIDPNFGFVCQLHAYDN